MIILRYMMSRRHIINSPAIQRQDSLKNGNRYSPMERPKSRRVLFRQRTSACLINNNLVNSGEPSTPAHNLSSKVTRLLLKHTKFGFIESFQNLILRSRDGRHSESDDLVQGYPTPDNIFYDKSITSKFVDKSDFDLSEVLGSGGFGSVFLGTFKGQQVAVKVMHNLTKNPAAQLESFKAELEVMCFNHANIVRTLAATHIDKFDEGAWVIMEYVGRNNLQRIINNPDVEIHRERRLKYSIQIASALSYAHKRKVAHLDLKPANILITDDDNCKVGDFGCCQMVEMDTGNISPTNRSILTGTFAYRAPELLRGEPPTFKADIYSYGVTLWQLRNRETPFCSQNQHVVIYNVVMKGLRPRDNDPAVTDPFEQSYKDVYKQCWVSCPRDRPSAGDLVELFSIWRNNL